LLSLLCTTNRKKTPRTSVPPLAMPKTPVLNHTYSTLLLKHCLWCAGSSKRECRPRSRAAYVIPGGPSLAPGSERFRRPVVVNASSTATIYYAPRAASPPQLSGRNEKKGGPYRDRPFLIPLTNCSLLRAALCVNGVPQSLVWPRQFGRPGLFHI